MATTPKSAASTAATASQRLRERLDKGSGDAASDEALRTLVDFWARLRLTLFANDASTGLDVLDELAAATMLSGDPTPAALTRTMLLLVSTDAKDPGHVKEHEVLAPPAAPTRPQRLSKRFPLQSKKAPPAKKQKTAEPLPFDVPPDSPAKIIKDLCRIEKDAASLKKTPAQVAYPWTGKRCWYDPEEHGDLHLVHWRFIMQFRAIVFLLALYAPSMDAAGRRKENAKAIKARLTFLSRNIEEFGWFGFPARFENSIHDTLMWFGGKPAKHSLSAKSKNKEEPPPEDLVVLLRDDLKAYEHKIKRMLDPHRVDEDGYASIPELLEQSRALDITLEPHRRLSDRALARIALDVSNETPRPDHWVGNRKGKWKVLLTDEKLRKVQTEVSGLLQKHQPVAVYNHRPYKDSDKGAYDSDFQVDGHNVIQRPASPITVGGPHYVDEERKARLLLAGFGDSEDNSDEKEGETYEHESPEEDEASENESDHQNDDEKGKAPASTATNEAESSDQSEEEADQSADK